MRRESAWCLTFFLVFVALVLGFSMSAAAAEKKQVQAKGSKIVADTGKKNAKGPPVLREFPVMFDIAERSKAKREEKQKKGVSK